MNGGPSPLSSRETVPQLEMHVSIGFTVIAPYCDKQFLNQKYTIEGLSIRQIATEIRSSKEAVRKGLMRHSIPLRKQSTAHSRTDQPRYGTRLKQGRLVGYQKEERVVQAIIEMQRQGSSLREIARILSQMGTPTKCRGKWHPEMVNRILIQAQKREGAHGSTND